MKSSYDWTGPKPIEKNLIYFFLNDDIAAVEQLLANGYDINAQRDNYDRLPIEAAIDTYRPDVLAFIISHGANVNQDLRDGLTPISLAIGYAIDGMIQDSVEVFDEDIIEIIRLLLSNGADLFLKDDMGVTALDWLNRMSGGIGAFNILKDNLRPIIPQIDTLVKYKRNEER